jgi:hypothetical protein
MRSNSISQAAAPIAAGSWAITVTGGSSLIVRGSGEIAPELDSAAA